MTDKMHFPQSLPQVRKRLVHNRTALTNEIRNILGEFGIVFSQGRRPLEEGIKGLLKRLYGETKRNLTRFIFTYSVTLLRLFFCDLRNHKN